MEKYLLKHNHKGLNVYSLNKEGRAVIGSENERKWTIQVEHSLMRNEMYIYYGCPKDWKVEKKVFFKTIGNAKEWFIKPDAWFRKDGIVHLVEVDRTQNMAENREKIKKYGELSAIMVAHFGNPPVVVFYTQVESRKHRLMTLMQEHKCIGQVYIKGDLN